MKIETFYPDVETSEKLNKLFSLPYNGQDWEIVNADSEKINDFINYYLAAEEIQEKVTIFALLIASIDMLDGEEKITNALNLIQSKMKANINYHLVTIIYWALIGHGKDKEHIFHITKYMRAFLSEFMNLDKFEVKTPSIKGIEINGIKLGDLIKENQFSKSFSELVNFLNKKTNLDEENFELSENTSISVEKENYFTHFEIWSSKTGCHYLKVETKNFIKEINKYEI